jgi:hypothetical protein
MTAAQPAGRPDPFELFVIEVAAAGDAVDVRLLVVVLVLGPAPGERLSLTLGQSSLSLHELFNYHI